MAMNPRLLRPLASRRLLLDLYPGAAVAYSLRRLRSGYSGPVVRVRRSSDSAEAEFTATEVSSGSLAAWVGAGNDGFVRTWFDQSTNAKNANQTTSSRQPKIVSSGSLVLSANNSPAMTLADSAMAPSGVTPFSGDYTWFGVCEPDLTTVNGGDLFNGAGVNNELAFFRFDRTNTRVQWFLGTAFVNSSGGVTQALQPVTLWSGLAANGSPNGTATIYRNSNQMGTGTPSNWSARTDGLSLFSYANGASNRLAGRVCEFVLYTSQQTNRAAIESALIKHYGIT